MKEGGTERGEKPKADPVETPCPECKGQGEHDGMRCPVCGGSGKLIEGLGG